MPKQFKLSRDGISAIPRDIYDAYSRNITRIREAGWYFGLDATGLAYIVVKPDKDGDGGTMVAGPCGPGEVAAHYGVKVLEESGL